MNKNPLLYFHIGFPKTASSFLQKKIFSQNSEINYLGIPEKKNWGKEEWYLYNFLLFLFSSNNDFFYRNIDKNIADLVKINLSQNKINMISHDSLTNSVYLDNLDIYESARRIKLVFENKLKFKIKVIFSIRNQSNMILSFYSQFYRKIIKLDNKWKKFSKFLKTLDKIHKQGQRNNKSKIFSNFFYFKYYKFLKKNFGTDNIKILIYEDLLFNPQFYFNEIRDFLKIKKPLYQDGLKEDVNQSEIINSNEYERKFIPIHKSIKKYINNNMINRFFYRLLTSDKVILKDDQKKLIKNYYLNDNIEMNKILNNRLEKYQYF